MKKIVTSLCAFFAVTAFAAAQQVQERLDQQPPPVTQQQVENDAKVAQLERKKEAVKPMPLPEKITEENKKDSAPAAIANSSIYKKASTTPGKQ